MKGFAVSAAVLLAMMQASLAQQNPCVRGQNFDTDQIRCELALVEQQRDAAMSAAARNQATVLINQSDFVAMRKEMEYWRAWAGYAPVDAKRDRGVGK